MSVQDVHVAAMGPDEMPVLAALFELYAYDFSDILGLDVGDDGRFHPPPLERYWQDPPCHAFLVRAGGRLAGFALVKERSRLTGQAGVYDMAEFFVLRRFRRQGVGERVATWLFDRFRGPWEVREKAANVGGTAFWRRTIGRYTSERFDDLVLDDERWRGPVQRFDSSARGGGSRR